MAITTLSSLTLRLSRGRAHRLSHLRQLSTLPQNPQIYIHPSPSPRLNDSYILSYLPSSPPNPDLAIGTSPTNPPTPSNFSTNPRFLRILHETLRKHAAQDPGIRASAKAFASSAGSVLAINPSPSPSSRRRGGSRTPSASSGGGVGASNIQGGYGSGGTTGFMHVSDERNPAAYGRIPEPEDIFGSLEVDSHGEFVDGDGRYSESGTYRVMTREGCLGLSHFLTEKLVEALEHEAKG